MPRSLVRIVGVVVLVPLFLLIVWSALKIVVFSPDRSEEPTCDRPLVMFTDLCPVWTLGGTGR